MADSFLVIVISRQVFGILKNWEKYTNELQYLIAKEAKHSIQHHQRNTFLHDFNKGRATTNLSLWNLTIVHEVSSEVISRVWVEESDIMIRTQCKIEITYASHCVSKNLTPRTVLKTAFLIAQIFGLGKVDRLAGKTYFVQKKNT